MSDQHSKENQITDTPEWATMLDHIRENKIKKRLLDITEVPSENSILELNKNDMIQSNIIDFETDENHVDDQMQGVEKNQQQDMALHQEEVNQKLYQQLMVDQFNNTQAYSSKETKILNEADYILYQQQVLDSGNYELVSSQNIQQSEITDLSHEENNQDLFKDELHRKESDIIPVQIVMPVGINHHPIKLINESELAESLYQKLLPHIQDAVTGMLKVAIQKQTQQMIQSIHQEIDQDLPELIRDLLRLYIKEALNKE